MSLPTKPAAYRDCYELYDLALATPGGVRAPVGTRTAARIFQLRMHKARTIEREFNARAYPRDNALHDTSPWDGYQVRVLGPDANDEWWIYVEPTGNLAIVGAAEPINPELAQAVIHPMIEVNPHQPEPRHAQPRLSGPQEPADLD